MKTYSLDLRERVVAAVDRGEGSQGKVAKLFGVDVSWLKKLLHQRRELGHIEPLPHGGGQKPLLDEAGVERLRAEVERCPDATLKELCKRVRGADGASLSVPTMSRTLRKLGFTRKKEGSLRHRTKASRTRRALEAHGGASSRRAPAHLH